jgi:hypothetical protein
MEPVPGFMRKPDASAVTGTGQQAGTIIDRRDTFASPSRPELAVTGAGPTANLGVPAITFDGSNYFTVSVAGVNVSPPYTIYVVGKTVGSLWAACGNHGGGSDDLSIVSGNLGFVDTSSPGDTWPTTGMTLTSTFLLRLRVTQDGTAYAAGTKLPESAGLVQHTDFDVVTFGAGASGVSANLASVGLLIVAQTETVADGTDAALRTYIVSVCPGATL